ncbi:MAG TPA: riboflavin synthase [Thermoanaerobaculales bacterium]|nr:riboflavin synthase [Thermoanaerobaculales bacterium]HQL29450.1 riboflavin synthase [Thermoanaerobaculales bacterium]
MFTGLVEAIGRVGQVRRAGAGARLELAVRWPHGEPPLPGDSVAVDGACLTVIEPAADGFSAELSPETLRRTLLGEIRPGGEVNLERALRLGDRIGGHLVQGHVDGLTRILSIHDEGGFSRWRLSLPAELSRAVASKGSVAVHGVSLTVAAVGEDWFEVALIPATLQATTLRRHRAGARLHLETDVLAKYVARRLGGSERSALEEMFGSGADHA